MAVITPLNRQTGSFVDLEETKGVFKISKKTFTQQFSQIYYVRLSTLLPILKEQASKNWSSRKVTFADRILDTKEGQLTCIMGTMYVEMEFKPNVLKDLAFDLQLAKIENKEKYVGGQMTYFIEDDSARIELDFSGKFQNPSSSLVTGVSLAILGVENEAGKFVVEEICLPGLESPHRPTLRHQPVHHGTIAFISGANFSSKQAFKFDLLRDLISGVIPNSTLSSIQRLVFVGNVAERPGRLDEMAKKKYGVEHARYDFANMNVLDQVLDDLVKSVPIIVMPGEGDPSNLALPQSPIHPGLFPKTRHNSTFHSLMNPCSFEHNLVSFLGTSGQNINDIARYTDISDRMEIAELTLKWRNLAPTSPDTLWCYPYYDRDPFILESVPDVYFIGNQPTFSTKVVTKPDGSPIRIVLLPNFSDTGCVALVNTADLSCHAVYVQ